MLTKLITLALFLTPSLASQSSMMDLFSANDDGLIELDLNIKKKPKKHLNNAGLALMDLSSQDGHNQETMDYIEKSLYTFMDIQLYANIFVGSNKQKFEMIFDSGSSWVWVQSKLCKKCMMNPHHFDWTKSKTFHQIDRHVSVLQYGRGTVWGVDSNDQICLTPNSVIGHGCMSDYLFKTVSWQKDLQGLEGAGIVGLSPTPIQGAQLFVPSLYKKGAIKKNMFSMFINENHESKIQLGGFNMKYALPGENIIWLKLTSHMYWEFRLDHVHIGDFSFRPSVPKIIADTGCSLNLMPDADFYNIYDNIIAPKFTNCHKNPSTLTVCDCTPEMHQTVPDINFAIDGKHFTINRDQWFERKGNKCAIKFMHNPGKQNWVMGLNFFQNYYTVFDYENFQMGFAKSRNFGQEQSHSLIKWIMTGENTGMSNLLQNLSAAHVEKVDQNLPGIRTVFNVSIIIFAIFFAFYLTTKKSNDDDKNSITEEKKVVEIDEQDKVVYNQL